MLDAALGSLKTVVCDQGSAFLKLGYATENEPNLVVPSMFAKDENGILSSGFEAQEVVNHKRVMINGIVQDWNGIEQLWRDSFSSQFETSGNGGFTEHKILVAEQTTNQEMNRKETFELVFETFQFGAASTSNEALLCLYSQGLSTGLVVDVGFESTRLTPIFDGYIPRHLSKRLTYGGQDVSKYLLNLLRRRGYHMYSKNVIDSIDQIKEKLCYAALNIHQERRLARETTVLVETFNLPDGTVLKIGQERFEAVESFFDPSVIDKDCKGLSDSIFDTIQNCDIDCRVDMLQTIILCGGSSLFPDFPDRIENDIKEIFLKKTLRGDKSHLMKYKIAVKSASHRHNVFLGGSIFAELMNNNTDFWVTKSDYEEEGFHHLMSRQFIS